MPLTFSIESRTKPSQMFKRLFRMGPDERLQRTFRALEEMEDFDKKVVATFPAVSPLRTAFRRMRGVLQGRPVYFYKGTELKRLCHGAGLRRVRLEKLSSCNYMLLGDTGAGDWRAIAKA